MKLKYDVEGDAIPKGTVAPSVDGKIKQFIPGVTQLDQNPFYKLKLEDDGREYIFYGGGWFELATGTRVTLHAFDGFEASHDSSENNYYLDGIEVKDKAEKVIIRIRRSIEMVFGK